MALFICIDIYFNFSVVKADEYTRNLFQIFQEVQAFQNKSVSTIELLSLCNVYCLKTYNAIIQKNCSLAVSKFIWSEYILIFGLCLIFY